MAAPSGKKRRDHPVNHSSNHGPCRICDAVGVPCAACRVDFYCGKEHQRVDWPRHKAGCGAIKVVFVDGQSKEEEEQQQQAREDRRLDELLQQVQQHEQQSRDERQQVEQQTQQRQQQLEQLLEQHQQLAQQVPRQGQPQPDPAEHEDRLYQLRRQQQQLEGLLDQQQELKQQVQQHEHLEQQLLCEQEELEQQLVQHQQIEGQLQREQLLLRRQLQQQHQQLERREVPQQEFEDLLHVQQQRLEQLLIQHQHVEVQQQLRHEEEDLQEELRQQERECDPQQTDEDKEDELAQRPHILVAARDVAAGTVILKEEPVVLFPCVDASSDQLFCMGCCVHIRPGAAEVSFSSPTPVLSPTGPSSTSTASSWQTSSSLEASGWTQCPFCGLPLCSETCVVDTRHQIECTALQRAGYKATMADFLPSGWIVYTAVAALRTLEASKTVRRLKQLRWELTAEEEKELQDAAELRAEVQGGGGDRDSLQNDSQRHGLRHLRAAIWLVRHAGCRWLRTQDLFWAAGVNFRNARVAMGATVTAMPVSRDAIVGQYCYVRPGEALLRHDCTPNTRVVLLDEMLPLATAVVTARDLRAGETLTSDSRDMWGESTMMRRRVLRSQDAMLCRCKRCVDPTELGLYVGSPCCAVCLKKGKRGFVLNTLAEDPVRAVDAAWRCEVCAKEYTYQEVKDATAKQSQEILELVKSPSRAHPLAWEEFLERHEYPKGPLHPTHCLSLSARTRLVSAVPYTINQAPTEVLKRWSSLCGSLLRAMDKLCPGAGTYRGRVLEMRAMLVHGMLLRGVEAFTNHRGPRSPQKKRVAREDVVIPLLDALRAVLAEWRPMAISKQSQSKMAGYEADLERMSNIL